MSIDVLELMKPMFNSQVTRQISGVLGESEQGTGTGLRTAIPALLAGLIHGSSDTSGAGAIFRSVTSASLEPELAEKLPGLLANRSSLEPLQATGATLLESVFGNRTGGVTQAISQVAGVKPAAAMSLLAVGAPVLFSLLKKLVSQGGLDAGGLTSLLHAQKGALQGAGLDSRITKAMGLEDLQQLPGSLAEPRLERVAGAPAYLSSGSRAHPTSIPMRSRERRWLPWALAVGIGALALVFLASRFGQNAQTRITQATPTESPTRLASSSAKVYFDTGEAALDVASRKTITDVASTVRASGSTVALTGYTDQTGNVDQNIALAKSRADAVHDALVAEGLPESNIVMKAPEFVTGEGSNAEARRVDIVRAPESPTAR